MRVLCTKPTGSTEVSGVCFTKGPGGMISDDMSEEAAARLLTIPGFEKFTGKPPKVESQEATPPDEVPGAKQEEEKAPPPGSGRPFGKGKKG